MTIYTFHSVFNIYVFFEKNSREKISGFKIECHGIYEMLYQESIISFSTKIAEFGKCLCNLNVAKNFME